MPTGTPGDGFGLLSVLIFAPLVAAAVAACLRGDMVLRWWALISTSAIGLASLGLLNRFDPAGTGFQLAERMPWVRSLGIEYRLGVDGMSVLLILLTTGLAPLCVLGSWRYIGVRVKEFMVCLLVMETAMVGVFCALDFVLFFVFWEAMLIPMSLLIGVWGGPRRVYAALKFFVYTMAGSALMLAAIIALRLKAGSFGIPEMMGGGLSPEFQCWVFGAFLLSFAIKVPMVPFHTWLPAAHVEAPTAGSVILAGVLLKMGTYGFLRFSLPITPHAARMFAPWLMWVSVAAILYGGLAALAQTDMKKLVAYSSVGHMGFATLGIFSLTQQGVEGATLVMINHGITTGALFLVVGMLYERLHSRDLARAAGLGRVMPRMAAFLGVFCLSSMAFPGTNSFVGEFLVMAGGFSVSKVLMICAVPGVVAAAAYNLRMLQTVAYGGTANPDHGGIRDLSAREVITLAPLLVLVLWLGLQPAPVVELMQSSVTGVLGMVRPSNAMTLVP
ncbi:MAG: NADH-quinone oxidoreductase subunit M [Verrucomicrobiales bacterium]|nr:NADH-quinone oxidoreductase subunit M [Verrucomicrobiales bacterium]